MKKWLKFFFLSFFSHKYAKEGVKRGYLSTFLGFILALAFLWGGVLGGDMLPFASHYNNSPDFKATAYAALANSDLNKRIDAVMENGIFKVKNQDGEYVEGLVINTFDNVEDRQNYSINGYHIVVDTHPADTFAEIEAYCVMNDGSNVEITYEEYLELTEVAKLNFDFKLRYTGNPLVLDDESVAGYRKYVDSLNEENKAATEKLENDLALKAITKHEYNKAIYELYFTNYYPEITAYETTSKVPLLRNYYYHNYATVGNNKYLFIFNDCMVGSFVTKGGIEVSFYGFYSDLTEGYSIVSGDNQEAANASVDAFIKNSFNEILILNSYAHFVNVVSNTPFIVLMFLVATLLTYSIMKLRSIESIASFGAMFRVVGSFAWFSGVISAVLSIILSFFVQRSLVAALPLVIFFTVIAIRSLLFAIKESRLYTKQLELQEAEQTEV